MMLHPCSLIIILFMSIHAYFSFCSDVKTTFQSQKSLTKNHNFGPKSESDANQMTSFHSINIKDKISKVLEPTLFSGSVPAIYQKKNLKIIGKRPDLETGEAPDEYEVRDGDTLFDICDQLLDDPEYWPKLWSMNPEAGTGITNPHFIYPGMKLRFRTEGIPSLVIDQANQVNPALKGGLTSGDLVQESPASIPTLSASERVSKVFDSKDMEYPSGVANSFQDSGFYPPLESIRVIYPGFIADTEDSVQSLGRVVGGTSGTLLSTQKSEIVIEGLKDLEIEKKYSVFRKSGRVLDPGDEKYSGFKFEFIAHVRVSTKNKQGMTYRGDIIYDRTGVATDDVILPFQSARREVPIHYSEIVKGDGQRVVAFGENYNQMGGQGSFVYLSQLPGKSLTRGMVYEISHNLKSTSRVFLEGRLPDTFKNIAKVYILDSSKNSALGYVLSVTSEIRLGDSISR